MTRVNFTTVTQSVLSALLLLFLCHSNAQIPNDQFPRNLEFNSAFSGAQGTETSAINAVHAVEKSQEAADKHYQEKRYQQAYEMYKVLAEHGDKFSQYRLAYMYENGYSVTRDMQQAFAWSYLAAENGDPGMLKYHRYVRSKFTGAQLKKAKQLAGQYLHEYGTFAQANKANKLLSRESRQCTGSRIGNSCHKIRASGWKCGLVSGNNMPATDCMMLGMVGLPGIAGLQPADLRKARQNLTLLQEIYNPGEVELGELRFIEIRQ